MRVRFVCFVIIFFGVLVLITACGEKDINVEWTESNGCTGGIAMGPYTVVAHEE